MNSKAQYDKKENKKQTKYDLFIFSFIGEIKNININWYA